MLSVLLGKERYHLGFLGPSLALNWEGAAHDLPITPPGTQHPAIRTWQRDEAPSLQLVMPFSSSSIKPPSSLECLSSLTLLHEWNPYRPEFPTIPPPSGDSTLHVTQLRKLFSATSNFSKVGQLLSSCSGCWVLFYDYCGFFTATGTGHAFFLSATLFPSSEFLTSRENQNRVKTSKAPGFRYLCT